MSTQVKMLFGSPIVRKSPIVRLSPTVMHSVNRRLFSLAVCAVIAISVEAQPSPALFAGDGRLLEYKADVETRAADIDDVFNASAKEGWRPRFVIEDEGRYRLLFARARNGAYEPMEYKAETLYFADNIADHFENRAAAGWRPLFVLPTGLRYRMLFEREVNPDRRIEREYRSAATHETAKIDDAFNRYAGQGWRAQFLLSATDSTEIRMLFRRKRGSPERHQYRAHKVASTHLLDDAYNAAASERWRPIFQFPDGDQYRILFERAADDDGIRHEYRAVMVDESREIDDALNRYAGDGWEPVAVFRDESKLQEYRLLLTRRIESPADRVPGSTP